MPKNHACEESSQNEQKDKLCLIIASLLGLIG